MSESFWAERYAQGDTPWDKALPAPPLLEGIARGFFSGRILVPGCGKGHDANALAQIPGCSVVGLDIVPQAIDAARRTYVAPGVPLEFAVVDFFNLTADYAGAFDAVFEHTCFCAIDPAMRERYVTSATGALRKGGIFFGIFFINPDTDEGPPFAVSRAEIVRLFDPHFEVVAEWVPETNFPGREGRERVCVLRKR
jgi:SAM-dependent methyltransferase